MKRIDRYVLTSFVVRLACVCALFFGLFIVFDMLKRIDHLRGAGMAHSLPGLFQYYYFLMPTLILDTVPVLLLLSAGLTLVNMSRMGELLTLKASGVSARRVVLPIFVFTLPVVLLIAWSREAVVPEFTRRHRVLDLQLDSKVVGTTVLRDAERNMTLMVQRYDYRNQDNPMLGVSVFEFYPRRGEDGGRGPLKSIIVADAGFWLSDGGISLETVTIQDYNEGGGAAGKPRVQMTKELETDLTPYDFVHAHSDELGVRLSAMTFRELRFQSRRSPGVKQFRVMLHNRLAAPFMPFVLLLLGIGPLVGFEASVRSRMLGVFLCIAVAAAFNVVSFVLISLGNVNAIAAPLAAWIPVGGGGAAGLWMFKAMRT